MTAIVTPDGDRDGKPILLTASPTWRLVCLGDTARPAPSEISPIRCVTIGCPSAL
jgi:hypothetical protein